MGRKARGTSRRPVAVDLFCGAGGMSLGFEQAGFDVLAAVDNDPVHLATYSFNFPIASTLCADISTISASDVLAAAGAAWRRSYPDDPWDESIDCVLGGPSCQGFSSIGRRDPADKRNVLVLAFVDLVAQLQPRYFVLENVPGILSPKNVSALSALLESIGSSGYDLIGQGPLTLDAQAFGVPQSRKRVFLVGVNRRVPMPSIPAPSDKRVTVGEAIDDLVNIELFDELLSSDSVRLDRRTLSAMEAKGSLYSQMLRSGPSQSAASVGLQYPRIWDRSVLTASTRTVHSASVRRRFNAIPQGAKEKVGWLPRLKEDAQATTLRAGTGRDHGSHTSPRPIHHLYDRVITVREAARLHSYPDWFRFHSTKWHGFRQVGNSVPPGLARAVATAIVDAGAPQLHPPARVLDLGDEELLTMSLQSAADHFGLPREQLPPSRRRSTSRRRDP